MPVDTGAWTTLANAKEHLGIASTNTSKDAYLTNLVNRSYKILEQYLGRTIYTATYTEYVDGDGTDTLVLKQYPITSVTSIHDDVERDFTSDTLVAATDYVSDSTEGTIRLYQNTASFSSGIQNIKVVYVAGYSTIPADLVQAANMHVAWLFNRSGTEGMSSQSLGGKSESYEPTSIPEHIKAILRPYKKYSV